jgi:hypothetical protein
MTYEILSIEPLNDVYLVNCYITLNDVEYHRPFCVSSNDPEIYQPEIDAYMIQVETYPETYLEGYING